MACGQQRCSKCAGLYCGRTYSSNNTKDCTLACTACERGYRSDSYFCRKCEDDLKLYDWLFLGFMMLCVTVLHFYAIGLLHSTRKKVWILHASALIEFIVSFISTILVFEPKGSFKLHTCGVISIRDWYTVFYNPKPDYVRSIHCTQEAVYPLFSCIHVYLLFCLLTMFLFRGLLLRPVLRSIGYSSLYAGLYIIPVIAVIHTCAAGLLYYAFPYLVLFLSTIGVAIFLSVDGYYFKLLKKPRRIAVLACYCLAHGYGIISITEMKVPIRDGPFLLLVILPFCFYTITIPFTNADNFKT